MVPTRRRQAVPHALAATLVLASLAASLLPATVSAQRRGEGPDSTSRPLHFEFLGPSDGGRIASISQASTSDEVRSALQP